MERLEFTGNHSYDALEAAIHLARYGMAKEVCRGKRVLDISCGQGYGSYLMATWGAAKVTGVDIDIASIDAASAMFQHENLSYIACDGEELGPFENDSFDLIVSLETIEHVHHPVVFLRELRRVLRPDGTLIVSCPNDHYYYPGEDEKNPFHLRKYTLEEFEELASGVLGSICQRLLGMPLVGYVNAAAECKADAGNPVSQLLMLQSSSDVASILVPPQSPPDDATCSYFVAVWCSPGNEIGESAAFYPIPMGGYPGLMDTRTALDQKIADCDNLQVAISEMRTALEQRTADCDVLRATLSDIRTNLELKISDCDGLSAALMEANGKLEELSGALMEAYSEREKQIRIKKIALLREKKLEDQVEFSTVMYHAEKNEKEFIRNALQAENEKLIKYDPVSGILVEERLRQIYDSRSYRFLVKLQRMADRVKSIGRR